MCGFIGVVAKERATPVDGKPVERALDMLSHRGPDARRIVLGAGFALGHVRLAIVDPHRRSTQPMWDQTGRYVLVYNGEVFNHGKLRRELESRGRRFMTNSDTEVVLHALLDWGVSCLARFHGQFALALYDSQEHTVLLARDAIGIKPLYYAEVPGLLLFASEPRAIFNHPSFSKRLNVHAVSSFLSYRQVLGNQSYFEGLNEVAPGTWLLVEHAQKRRFAPFVQFVPSETYRPVSAKQLRRRIGEAVGSQLTEPSARALMLSGGLDSSILAAEGARVRPDLVAYTIRMEHADYDESGAAARVAASYGLPHVSVPVSHRDHLDHAEELVRHKAAPLGMHNEIETFLLAKAIAKRSKAVLCGEGADELFAGYGRIFRLPFEATALRLRRFGLRNGRMHAWWSDAFNLLVSRYTYFPLEQKAELFVPEVWRAISDDEQSRNVLRATFFECSRASFFERIWAVFLRIHLRGLLSMVDAMTMAASVEARVPFLDPAVVDAAHSLPARDKLRWRHPWSAVLALGKPAAEFSERLDIPKYLLRRAYRDVLPAEVLTRRKQGFPVPLFQWYGTSPNAPTRQILLRKGAQIHHLMQRPKLEAFIERATAQPSEASGRQLFQLVSLELFLRNCT